MGLLQQYYISGLSQQPNAVLPGILSTAAQSAGGRALLAPAIALGLAVSQPLGGNVGKSPAVGFISGVGKVVSPLQGQSAISVTQVVVTNTFNEVQFASPIPMALSGMGQPFGPANRETVLPILGLPVSKGIGLTFLNGQSPISIGSCIVAQGNAIGVSYVIPIHITSCVVSRISGGFGLKSPISIGNTVVMRTSGGRALSSPVFIAGPLASYVVNAIGRFPVVGMNTGIFGLIIPPTAG